jgi:drug/metabolite transporter (DMT)-like permease
LALAFVGVPVMLTRGTAARASTNFYLVPGTAALLAWVIPNERLGALAMLGLVLASAGCWLVGAKPRRAGRRAALARG